MCVGLWVFLYLCACWGCACVYTSTMILVTSWPTKQMMGDQKESATGHKRRCGNSHALPGQYHVSDLFLITVLIVRCFREASPIGSAGDDEMIPHGACSPVPNILLSLNGQCFTRHLHTQMRNAVGEDVFPVPKLQSANFKQGCRLNVDGCLFFVTWEICRCHSSYVLFLEFPQAL